MKPRAKYGNGPRAPSRPTGAGSRSSCGFTTTGQADGSIPRSQEMGEPEVEACLTHRAIIRRLAESTPNQALGAIRFLCRHVWAKDWGSLDAVRANLPKRLPTVLSQEE